MSSNQKLALLVVMVLSALTACKTEVKKKKYDFKMPNLDIPTRELKTTDLNLDAEVWKPEVEKRARTCVESICDVEEIKIMVFDEEIYSLRRKDEIPSLSKAEEVFRDRIWPTMLEFTRQDVKQSREQSEAILSLFSSIQYDSRFSLTPVLEKYLRWSYAVDLVADQPLEYWDEEHYEQTGIYRLSDAGKSSLSEDEINDIGIGLKMIAWYHSRIEYNAQAQIKEYGLRTYLLVRYENDESAEPRRQYIESIDREIEIMRSFFPLLANRYANETSFKKLKADKDLLPSEEFEIASMHEAVSFFTSFYKHSFKPLDHLRGFRGSEISSEEVLSAMKTRLEDLEEDKVSASRERTYEVCKKTVSAFLVSRPTAEQKDRFNGLLNQMKTKASQVAKAKYPGRDLVIEENVTNAKFYLPETRDEGINRILTEVQQMTESTRSNVDFTKLKDDDLKALAIIMVAIGRYDSASSEESEFSDLSDLCQTYLPKLRSDHTYTFQNKIVVQIDSLKNPTTGIAIAAHEIGHRIEATLGDLGEKVNKCLTDRNFYWLKDASDEVLSATNTQQFQGEDFADHIASLVLKEMDITSSEYNLGCKSFQLHNDPDYPHLYFGNPGETHPMYASRTDVHSTPLTRLLRSAKELGHMTKACSDFVKKEESSLYWQDLKFVNLPKVNSCLVQ